MKNGRCRMHGGQSTGAKTPEGLERIRQAHWKTGYYSGEAVAERRAAYQSLRAAKFILDKILGKDPIEVTA